MDVIADRITIWLIHNKVIAEKDREIYLYAIYSMLMTFIPIIPILIVEVLLGDIKGCCIMLSTFFAIRKFCGGYHMDNPYMCAISSAITIITVVYLGRGNNIGWGYISALIIAYIGLFINEPIDSENRRLEKEEKNRCKKITILICFATMPIIAGLYAMNAYSECKYVMLGVIMAAALQIMGFLKNRCK